MKQISLMFTTVVVVITLTSNNSFAQLNGPQIMQKVYDLPTGEDTQRELTMTLVNKQGEQRVRKLKQYIKNEEVGTEKRLCFL